MMLLFVVALWAVPRTINYQGKLSDSDGIAINDTVDITFAIYDTITGGVPLWSEAHSVIVTQGLFDVVLGKSVPLNLSFNEPYYLQLTVEGEVLSPRQSFSSVPYSFTAHYADTAIYARYVSDTIPPGNKNYIWNQDTVVQDANLSIWGTATVGTLVTSDIRGQGYITMNYLGAPTQINDTSFIILFSSTYNAAGGGSGILMSFTGTFDDRAGKKGASIEIQLVRDPGAGESILTSQNELLANIRTFSDRTVTLTTMDFPSAGMHTYAVRAKMKYEHLDAGRFIKGNIQIVEIKK